MRGDEIQEPQQKLKRISVIANRITKRFSNNYYRKNNPHVKGLKYVIFPNNKKIRWWDFLMILVVLYYAFWIPFHFGVGGGVRVITIFPYFIFHMCIDAIFIADSILVFFRAYREKDGRLIFSHRSIARRYVTSGWFFINLLGSFPSTLVTYVAVNKNEFFEHGLRTKAIHLVYIFSVMKLFRLIGIEERIIAFADSFELTSQLWVAKIRIEQIKILETFFAIILLVHWFACIWGFVAFVEVRGWNEEMMSSTPNWIGNWQKNNSIPGGLNALGWENSMDRYWLCMFWAIQTVTSIGYGNIIPVTAAEFALANFLMLCSGMFWAYIVANLVEYVAHTSRLSRDCTQRVCDASHLVWSFTAQKLPESVTGSTAGAIASNRVGVFLSNERVHCTNNLLDEKNALTLSEAYPTLDIVSPELRKVCALHLMHTYMEAIPYLSSKYLSPDERAAVALQCRTLEFSAGEHFSSHPEFGRGVIIFKNGLGFTSRNIPKMNFKWARDLRSHVADVNEVLVEDEYFREKQLIYHFVQFTKVLFVPRSAIMSVLEQNPVAWKECARWRYLGAALVLSSFKEPPVEEV